MSRSDSGKATVARGLKDVVAAETAICNVDGATGSLIYRGYDVDELAEHSSYEETAFLLLHGELPTPFQLDEFRELLAANASLPMPVDEYIRRFPRDASPMAELQAAVA